MKLNFLKWLPLFAASTLLYGANEEIADAGCQPCKQPAPCTTPCTPVKTMPMPACNMCQDPCCPPMAMYNRNVNPPARATRGCTYDTFANATFLYWRGDEADMTLGFVQTQPVGGNPLLPIGATVGDLIQFDYNWEPGVRVGLGWESPAAEGWDVYLNWTWLRDSASVNETVTPDNTNTALLGITPFWNSNTTISFLYGNLSASWKLLYNMFDLELGRDFFVSCNLSLRPYASVEGGWINRKWSVTNSQRATQGLPDSAPDFQDTYKNTSNYWGIGPRAGLSGNWWLGWGFKFFGNLAGSILSGNVYENKATLIQFTTATAVITSHWEGQDIFRVVPHLQAMVGLGWMHTFSCNNYALGINVGWEANHFWNIPMATYPDIQAAAAAQFTNRENRSHNLALSGLNVDVRFDF